MNPNPSDEAPLSVTGSQVIIRLRGKDTGGTVSMIETRDEPGTGPPPHLHQREDETFHVLEGEYEITCGGVKHRLRVGDTIFAPRGVPHAFLSVGDKPGRLLVTLTPAGFEGFFEEVGALSEEENQIPRVIEIGESYGLRFISE
jgi:quercetin dioxygenase-like cupin family protein